MSKVFRKEKMVARIIAEGRTDSLTPEIEAIMDNLDGQEATEHCWNRQVYGSPVLWVVGKNGVGDYVNENDCEWGGKVQ